MDNALNLIMVILGVIVFLVTLAFGVFVFITFSKFLGLIVIFADFILLITFLDS
jgi:hypothetical protein